MNWVVWSSHRPHTNYGVWRECIIRVRPEIFHETAIQIFVPIRVLILDIVGVQDYFIECSRP